MAWFAWDGPAAPVSCGHTPVLSTQQPPRRQGSGHSHQFLRCSKSLRENPGVTAFSWTFPKDVSQRRLAVLPGEIHQQPHRPDRTNPDLRRTGTSLPFCKILGKTPRLLSPGSRELKGDGIPVSPPHSEPVASDADVARQHHGPLIYCSRGAGVTGNSSGFCSYILAGSDENGHPICKKSGSVLPILGNPVCMDSPAQGNMFLRVESKKSLDKYNTPFSGLGDA